MTRGCALQLDVPPGRYVMLSVSDTGVGMDAEVAGAHLRAVLHHQGRGQGHRARALDGVRHRASRAAATSRVQSEVGRGTTFRIYLPRADSARRGAGRPAARRRRDGTETVLLVEDDAAVRGSPEACCRERGYTVLTAPQRPAGAARWQRRTPAPIHLLVTDVVMPGMSGRGAGRRAARAAPGDAGAVHVGYTDDAVVRQGVHGRAALVPAEAVHAPRSGVPRAQRTGRRTARDRVELRRAQV